MDYQELLLELEDTVNRISGGINAIGIMTMGLVHVSDPYADGFHMIWNCLVDADRDLQNQVKRCLNAK